MESIWLLFAVNLVICAWGIRVSSSSSMGVLAESALNPVLILWIFHLCCNVLYAAYGNEHYVYHPRATFYAPAGDRLYSYVIFTLFSFALALGNTVAARASSPLGPSPYPQDRGLPALPLFLASLSISGFVVLYLIVVFNVRSTSDLQALTADRFVAYRESSLVIYLFMLPFLVFSAYCSKSKFRLGFFLCFALTFLAAMASGNRINILSLFFALGAALTLRGWRFPRRIWLAFPMLGLASAYSLYYLRGFKAYSSVDEQVQRSGGWVDLLVNPFEFHYHLSLTSIVTMGLDDKIDRIPGEAFWAALFLPVPRSIMPFKGLSPSAPYSEIINPDVWFRFASQTTLGVFGDVYLEFGLVAGSLVVFLLGWLWYRMSTPDPRRAIEVQAMVTTAMLALTILFVRAGITQMAQIFWSWLALRLMFALIGGLYSKPPAAMRPNNLSSATRL
ncbi:MAG: oligosaccharide repeat unit polymerase [Alphaproteobacteria bacterium]|nr:oligosaccharide repeat unit polymerase [Alphaproteobacteria bacterium]MBU1550763.1 oligosaccharide repeat unit polymerase [Alphaproteobacteria bacterium]MBU2338899.1 oligosaccharide repeat unit polymerase [Alphaproteobacteria bacterium]MBU2386990.1 oligosaccharide repeat unit polymerase [Alphaproteobacteria bacterium]